MKQEYDFSKGIRGKFFRDGAKLRFATSDETPTWTGSSGRIGLFIEQEAQRSLNAYREQPKLVTEHARSEQDTAQGGYSHRQLFELVQNSADALLESPRGRSILIRLTDEFLYCADDGTPIDENGVEGLMFDRMSSKRNTAAIGRFGRGFKSVLRVTDAPEFYSRSGSLRFDKKRSATLIAEAAAADLYPVLRLPEPIDPDEARKTDEDLRELMSWATNIVRLPLRIGAQTEIARQMQNFPPEFMLFVDHVQYLTLENGDDSRSFMLSRNDGELHLDTGVGTSRWLRLSITHCLSPEARADWHLHGDNERAQIQWAVPLDRLTDPGRFWAFFPTDTASLVAGILNAPWKTNEDRQSLLQGPHNDELIEAAAGMIAEMLPQLSTADDPARHLDALPRRHERSDSAQVDLLRECLFSELDGRAIVPDQDGRLREIRDISYPPKKLTDGSDTLPLEQWTTYPDRPRDWLHCSVVTRNRVSRLAAINRLFPPRWAGDDRQSAPQESIAEWLEALVEGKEGDEAIQASMAAILTAASIPPQATKSNDELGCIVLTADRAWRSPEPDLVFLSDDSVNDDDPANRESRVHPKLASDPDTLSALKKLGIKAPSSESSFRLAAKRILETGGGQAPSDDTRREFWIASRKLSGETALAILRKFKSWNGQELWRSKLRVQTRTGNWSALHSVLFPGDIVPGDGNRDQDATVDTGFHGPDEELLRHLGVTDVPHDDHELSAEPLYNEFRDRCRDHFTSRPLERNPQPDFLTFVTSSGCGPLHVLTRLSEEGRAAYTTALLSLDSIFSRWTMRHETRRRVYPDLSCESFSISVLRNAGRIRTASGAIVPLANALGPTPKNPEALHTLLALPMADKIKAAFDLAEPTPELFGEADPIPLTDVWPGLEEHLPAHRKQCRIVACERILVLGQSRECVFHAPDVYITGTVEDDERHKLQLVADELELPLGSDRIEAILQRRTPAEIEERRAAIRRHSSDAERLLAAVGEQTLRQGLPVSLMIVLEKDGVRLSGPDIAEAAIATYHTDALRQYRGALDHLGPPSRWAGSARAVRFVRSLGFSADWAGERNRRLEPFLEIEGRYRLPDLHGYQKVVVRNLRKLLCGDPSNSASRRGMVSMPTGSGKTRVAVQGIVEAMRDDSFVGGVLWVADRSELCEQAVEAWCQVWSSIGPHDSQLRISRMWDGQPKPLPTSELHVVVATIQTLHARLSSRNADYDFLKDFGLVVFDEAHRSIAPTFTSVMDEIGLTRRQGAEEPFLLGLTATPYRGYNEEETRWLANRYGGNRLDAGAFEIDNAQDVIQALQSMNVLAQVDHDIIEGSTFQISDNELDEMMKFTRDSVELERLLAWLPPSAEKRIAQSAERTTRIIDAYGAHIDSNWPTLIFATSVEHAQTVAALLNRKGIRSRAVSGETETMTRRRVVEEFRRGEIKALVNYGVFREGFDAPKTRAIIVARPVYSPNLYFQMIGRGLRGRLNGGDDRCLILNVQDNIENFDRSLAFSDLDWLWT